MALEDDLGYRFRNRKLLSQALVHSSYVAEHPEVEDNERLEFLGDAVLQMVVTDYVYSHWGSLPEGEMAKIRAASVSGDQLADVARSLDLGPHLLLGRGELSTGGREKDSILGDALEAVIAAVYLDGAFESARELILRHWKGRVEESAAHPGKKDFKTRLQELVAPRGVRPRYVIEEEGLDHDKTFTATVEIAGASMGSGSGRSKKQAEQRAARATLRLLRDDAGAS